MRLSLSMKIAGSWILLCGFVGVLIILLPHRDFSTVSMFLVALMSLISIVAFAIVLKEESRRNKAVFLNFAVFFAFSLHSYVYLFVGHTILTQNPFASFFFYQYGTNAIAYFLLALAIVYVVLDTLFSHFKVYQKYILSLLIVGGTFGYYYYPILENPKYLYQTEDILDYKEVSGAIKALKEQGIADPNVEQIASNANVHAWKDGKKIGTLFEEEKRARVAELLPYLVGENYIVLTFKPLYSNVIYLNVLCLVFIFVFFGYQYKNDPPQGAYIEKILFLFLPYCSLEIVHYFGYIKSVEFAAYLELYNIGVYLTMVVLLGMLLFFSLRLRFITSVTGNFYEQELVCDPEHTSRWRDTIDSLIVRHFLNPKTFHGRLLAPRPTKREA